jgi:hypothetical protein
MKALFLVIAFNEGLIYDVATKVKAKITVERSPTTVLEKCRTYFPSKGTVVVTMLLVALSDTVIKTRNIAAYIRLDLCSAMA